MLMMRNRGSFKSVLLFVSVFVLVFTVARVFNNSPDKTNSDAVIDGAVEHKEHEEYEDNDELHDDGGGQEELGAQNKKNEMQTVTENKVSNDSKKKIPKLSKKKKSNKEEDDELSSNDRNILKRAADFYQEVITQPSDGMFGAGTQTEKQNNATAATANPGGRTIKKSSDLDLIVEWEKSREYYVPGDEDLRFLARIYNRTGAPARVSRIDAGIYNDRGERVDTLTYQKQNGSDDYVADYSISSDANIKSGKYLVKLNIRADGQTINRIDTFSINYPKVKPLYRTKEQLTPNKNLLFYTMLTIYESGNYVVQASLYDNNDKKIDSFDQPVSLKSGRIWVPIEFPGRTIYRNKVVGQLVLKDVGILKLEDNLSFSNREYYTLDFKTKPYRWDEFSEVAPTDPAVKAKIDQLSEQLAQ